MAQPVTSIYLLQGAYYALEQCGGLLRDANVLYTNGSYATAVVLAAFAREEMGRTQILLNLREKVLAGEVVTVDIIRKSCENHLTKQDRAVISTVISTTNDTALGKMLQARLTDRLGTDEWKATDAALKDIDASQRKRAKTHRHQLRMRALYVEPSGSNWNRPSDMDKKTAHAFLIHAVNDYVDKRQRFQPELLAHFDDRFLKELEAWNDRPALPAPQWPGYPD